MIQDNQLMNIRNGIVLDALICVKIAITPFKKKKQREYYSFDSHNLTFLY